MPPRLLGQDGIYSPTPTPASNFGALSAFPSAFLVTAAGRSCLACGLRSTPWRTKPMKLARLTPSTVVTGAFVAALLAAPARGDVIMDWNAKADAIAACQLPWLPQHG